MAAKISMSTAQFNSFVKGKVYARGRIPRASGMNKLEAEYARILAMRKSVGVVVWYAFEPFSLRLARATHYCPDFCVQLEDGTIEIHEVKGHMEDDAWAKLKIAATMFPFLFVLVRKSVKAGWTFEVVG